MKSVLLLGRSVGASLSPAMQNTGFASVGLRVRYLPVSVEPGDLPLAVEALRALELGGANVTVPYKDAVVPLLDGVQGAAARLGSVNTIVNRDGRLTGYSTDGHGFARACAFHGIGLAGVTALMVGAGGAARCVADALAGCGARRLVVIGRSRAKTEALAGVVRAARPGFDVSARTLEECRAGEFPEATLVVNAASSDDWVDRVDREVFPSAGAVACDLTYRADTRFLAWAASRGMRGVDGLAMLLYQGVASFGLWTGLVPPEREMGDALAAAARLPVGHFDRSGALPDGLPNLTD
jgi:shikimate dehydrogenase